MRGLRGAAPLRAAPRPLVLSLLLLAARVHANDVDDEENPSSIYSIYSEPKPPPPPPPTDLSVSEGSSCAFKAATGEAFDLSPMKQLVHDFTGTTVGGYTYRFNVCGNTANGF